jgi:hypothetical protein
MSVAPGDAENCPPSLRQWKATTGTDLGTLVQLEKKKRQLAQQIFYLDLHQKATFKQYQKIIAKIGAFNPSTDPRRCRQQTLPEIRLPFAGDVGDRIATLRTKLREAHALFDEKKEVLCIGLAKAEMIAKLPDSRSDEAEEVPRAEEGFDEREDEVIVQRRRETARKFALEKAIKRHEEELRLLEALETNCQDELEVLCEAGKSLVRQRKWHLGTVAAPRQISWSFYREDDSFM